LNQPNIKKHPGDIVEAGCLAVMHLSMVCPRMGEGGTQPSGICPQSSTRKGILASITISFLSIILKNYQKIIEKNLQKGQESDSKCRPKGRETLSSGKLKCPNFPWFTCLLYPGANN